MREKIKITFMAIALSAMAFISCSSGDDDDDNITSGVSSGLETSSSSSSNETEVSSSSIDGTSSSLPYLIGALKAEPVAADKSGSQPEILYSWTNGDENYYIINAGYIKNSLIMKTNSHRNPGYGVVKLTLSSTVETSVAENSTNTVSNSIVVSVGKTNTHSETITIDSAITKINIDKAKVEGGVETGGIAKWLGAKGSIKAGYEHTWENGSVTSNSKMTSDEVLRNFEMSSGKASEISESFMNSLRKESTDNFELSLDGATIPIGWHRYAWYAISDIYFIISTSLNNKELLNWEVVSIPRGDNTDGSLEFSSDNTFDNSPVTGDEIKFAEEFWKALPLPKDSVIAKPEPTIKTETIKIYKDTSFTLNKGSSMEIELCAVGGGGGGQGGHNWRGGALSLSEFYGTGGAGGGGATACMKFVAADSISCKIIIGVGGTGGEGTDLNGGRTKPPWNDPGKDGRDGQSTVVSCGTNTLTVPGGKGGNSTALYGGNGGVSPEKPSLDIFDWLPNSGVKGEDGCNGGDTGCNNNISLGGKAGQVSSSLGVFPNDSEGRGGNGGSGTNSGVPNSGSKGNDGYVVIIVTYPEN